MATNMKRLMISIPADIENEINNIKQKEYYNKPYSELYRQIIRLGLDKMRESQSQKKYEVNK